MKTIILILACLFITAFIPFVANSQVTDIDGNVYKTVEIGTQIWMAENLKATKYNDGTDITFITDNTHWNEIYTNSLTTPAYCWYNNDIANKTTYGALYNWYSINATTNGNKNVCPTEWHVPTDAEWTTLSDYLGGESIAGGKLKESGTTHWKSPNEGATNEYGFSALPGGGRYGSGPFGNIGSNGFWWSATESKASNAWSHFMIYSKSNLYRDYFDEVDGFSVRCIKD